MRCRPATGLLFGPQTRGQSGQSRAKNIGATNALPRDFPHPAHMLDAMPVSATLQTWAPNASMVASGSPSK
jgi:hypothetical protein